MDRWWITKISGLAWAQVCYEEYPIHMVLYVPNNAESIFTLTHLPQALQSSTLEPMLFNSSLNSPLFRYVVLACPHARLQQLDVLQWPTRSVWPCLLWPRLTFPLTANRLNAFLCQPTVLFLVRIHHTRVARITKGNVDKYVSTYLVSFASLHFAMILS
jgi:hypothetical protein